MLITRIQIEWSYTFSSGRNVPLGASLARLATSSTQTFIYTRDRKEKAHTSLNRHLRQEYEEKLRGKFSDQ